MATVFDKTIRTHCVHGHELTPENTYVNPRGTRSCRYCLQQADTRYEKGNPEKHNKSQAFKRNKKQFGGNREIVIQRDGEKCVKCGMTREEHRNRFNKDITVDHIDGKGCNTPVGLKNNSINNLQTLCFSCHGRKDRLRTLNNREKEPHDDQR